MRFALVLTVFCGLAFADKPICVRDFQGKGKSACDVDPKNYTWVYPQIDDGRTVCARIYGALYCSEAPKEYNEVIALNGDTICVLNNNQPPVVNLCDSKAAEFYDYIEEGP